jgi:hypothetical protein
LKRYGKDKCKPLPQLPLLMIPIFEHIKPS